MIRTDLLRGKFAEKRMSQIQIARVLGITPKAFYDKMKRGVFRSDEMQKMIDYVGIENPVEIFFAKECELQDANDNKGGSE